MKINKETTIILSVKDVEDILKEHLKTKGYDVKSVRFSVSGHNEPDDYFSQYPLTYKLDEVICKTEE